MQTLLVQLCISLSVAIITSWLTVTLSLRKFYREKWWEQKYKTYTNLVGAMYDLKRDAELKYDAVITYRDTDNDFHKEWSKKSADGWNEVRKLTDIGSFAISSKALNILNDFLEYTKYHHDSYDEYLENTCTAAQQALPKLIEAARADLQVKDSRSWILGL